MVVGYTSVLFKNAAVCFQDSFKNALKWIFKQEQ